MVLSNSPRAMVLVAILSVVITWFAVTRISTFFGLEQRLILMIAPLASLAVAIAFLYVGRSRLRFPADRTPDQIEVNDHALPSSPGAANVIAAESIGMDTVLESPPEPDIVIAAKPIGIDTVEDSPQEPREAIVASPSTENTIEDLPPTQSTEVASAPFQDTVADLPPDQSSLLAGEPVQSEITTSPAQSAVMASAPVQDTIAASPEVQSAVEVVAPSEDTVAASPQAQSTAMVGAPVQSTVVADEIPPSVEKVMQEIEKRSELRCLVITAPSHGVLQDRLNNWLSGKYGRVVSSSLAASDKGFYMALFYEPVPLE